MFNEITYEDIESLNESWKRKYDWLGTEVKYLSRAMNDVLTKEHMKAVIDRNIELHRQGPIV